MPHFIQLCPELGDGQCSFVLDDVEEVLDAVRTWAEQGLGGMLSDGEAAEITVVEMTQEEYDALGDEGFKPQAPAKTIDQPTGVDLRFLIRR